MGTQGSKMTLRTDERIRKNYEDGQKWLKELEESNLTWDDGSAYYKPGEVIRAFFCKNCNKPTPNGMSFEGQNSCLYCGHQR
jgi:hypothetical protein